jgi:hypothetical protein
MPMEKRKKRACQDLVLARPFGDNGFICISLPAMQPEEDPSFPSLGNESHPDHIFQPFGKDLDTSLNV